MGHTLVQSATQVTVSASGATSFSISFAATPTAGNSVILVGAIWHNTITWTITNTTDNQGNPTYTTRTANAQVGSTHIMRALCAHQHQVSASGTFTVSVNCATVTSTYYDLGLMEYSGFVSSAQEDVFLANQNIATGTGPTDANVGPTSTTAQANELAVGVACLNASDATVNWGSPASYTNRYRQNNATGTTGLDAATRDLTSAGTQTLQWSHDNNAAGDVAGALIVTFKDAADSAGTPPLMGQIWL